MPIRVGTPSDRWQIDQADGGLEDDEDARCTKEQFEVATDLYYVNVTRE